VQAARKAVSAVICTEFEKSATGDKKQKHAPLTKDSVEARHTRVEEAASGLSAALPPVSNRNFAGSQSLDRSYAQQQQQQHENDKQPRPNRPSLEVWNMMSPKQRKNWSSRHNKQAKQLANAPLLLPSPLHAPLLPLPPRPPPIPPPYPPPRQLPPQPLS
jgi:hypothetical protein